MSGLLPLFPLHMVAYPRKLVALYIFEPRYKEMVGEAITGQSEFGIVPATKEGISSIGCTVVVEQAGNYRTDGSFDITARGKRRFRILSLNFEKEYLRGEVEYLEDPPAIPSNGHRPATVN